MKIIKNKILHNPETKEFLADIFYKETDRKLPLVVFAHGYKGYKDWGAWNLMAKTFAEHNFFFVKFNFSFNGTTLGNPNEFVDLQSFGENNYSKELSDLHFVINYFSKDERVDAEQIYVIGHSRGGGISLINTAENSKVKKLVLLASIADLSSRFPEDDHIIQHWKNEGVVFVKNARTGQELPHYFQFYEDFMANKERFNIEEKCKNISIPSMIFHGTNDESVDFSHAEKLKLYLKNSQLIKIENANHTFGAKEPWTENFLPQDLEKVIEHTIDFLQS